MKKKLLKKQIKKSLFNFFILKNIFLLFTINNEIKSKIVFDSFSLLIESFPKYVLRSVKIDIFNEIKYPYIIKLSFILGDFLKYISALYKTQEMFNVFFIKIYFLLLDPRVDLLRSYFLNIKSVSIIKILSFNFLKTKQFSKFYDTAFFRFVS